VYVDALAHLATNGGLITRGHALDLGLSPLAIRALLRREWVVVRRGVYAEAETWEALDDYRGRPLLRAHAAILTMRRGWVLSHDSAAHQQGLDILTPDVPLVHVTRPGHTNAWTQHGVSHHLARYRKDQVVTIDAHPCLDVARTACDIARERGVEHGVAAMDSALRRGVPREALWAAVAPMTSWPHVTEVRDAIELADPGAANPAETRARTLVREMGIGEVETQFPLMLGDRLVWCDLRVGRHVFEFDGRVKYRRVEDGGVADRPIDQVVWEEKLRERLIRAEGFGVSRILAPDLHPDRRRAAKARLRAEYDVTVARFGTDLPPHVARTAAELRGRHGA